MSPEVGDINFWVSGDTFPDFSHLYCDLVFAVYEKVHWEDANSIAEDDPIVDSHEAYSDHYRWAYQHPFKRRQRFTLKAGPARSFQPQDDKQSLIDIVPCLNDMGISLEALRGGMHAGFQAQPYLLDSSIVSKLYDMLNQGAAIKLTGAELQNIRKHNPQLAGLKVVSRKTCIGKC